MTSLTVGLWLFHCAEIALYTSLLRHRFPDASWLVLIPAAIVIQWMIRFALFLVNYIWAGIVSKMPFSGLIEFLRIYLHESFALMRTHHIDQPLAPFHHSADPKILEEPRSQHATGKQSVPIVLVHGYMCDGSMWTWFKRELARNGFEDVWSISLLPPIAGIDYFAELLLSRIQHIRKTTGCDQVDIIAHSMGGLVTRRMMANGNSDLVRRIVSLGTPHQGTKIAHLSFGFCGWQMRPNHKWIKALKAEESDGWAKKLTSIYSRHDQVIVPNTNSIVPDATNHELTGPGHLALVQSKEVVGLCVEYLTVVK